MSARRFALLIPGLPIFVLLMTVTGCAAPDGTDAAETPVQPYVMPAVVRGTAPPNPYGAAQIARGKELITLGGCVDCHTPWRFDPDLGMAVPDMTRFLSGHPEGAPGPQGKVGPTDVGLFGPTFTAVDLPFGRVYSANLTPDIDTGIGTWTEEMFVDIFRKGRHLGGDGRPVLPPMPWPNLHAMPREDLVAMFAYLRSLPPVRNNVPSPEVPEEAMWVIRDSFDKMLQAIDSAPPPPAGS